MAATLHVHRFLGPVGGCDPRPPRRMAATQDVEVPEAVKEAVAILGHPGGWPPPRRAAADRGRGLGVAILGHPGRWPPHGLGKSLQRIVNELRSSATPEDGRHT